ncbi:MAG: DUF4834 family protein [Flavobacteriaceae bacterium]
MGVLKTIAIIMLVWYGLKIIGRFAFPIILKRFMGKMEDRFKQQMQGQDNQKKEDINIGETIIDKKTREKTSNDTVGEYVEYEDVD